MEPLTYTVHTLPVLVGHYLLHGEGSKRRHGIRVLLRRKERLHQVLQRQGYKLESGNPHQRRAGNSDQLAAVAETGPTPGSIGVVWYGSTATSNSDNANWKVFFAQSANITSPNPTVRQAEVSDHFIHGSNISLAGLAAQPDYAFR